MIENIWDPLFQMVETFIVDTLSMAFVALVGALALFLLFSRINPFRLSPEYLESLQLRFLPFDLFRWLLYDMLTAIERVGKFSPFGFTIFCGSQGSGKTISMVEYARILKERYPRCIIVANFKCTYADRRMTDWRDFLEIRNGEDGVLFLIDEIQSEYNTVNYKDLPETLFSEICMQRKQRVKIVASAQVYSRVAKQLREQTFSVSLCRTYFGRLTIDREYEMEKFSSSGDSVYNLRKGVKPYWRHYFVQSNEFRKSYDTYEKIERMKKLDFIPRNERGASA